MLCICKREIRSFFHSMIGWVFGAFLLLMAGIYFTAYNLNYGYPLFSYTLSSITFLFLIVSPILAMRTLAEERKQKTDQLLLTAPVTVWQDCVWKIPGTDRHFSSSGRDPVFLSADHGTVRKHCFCIYLRGTAWFFSAWMYLPGCGTVLLVSYGKPDSCRSRNLRFSAGMLSDGWNQRIFPGNCRCFPFCTCCHCSAYRFADLSYHTEHPASACDRCHR